MNLVARYVEGKREPIYLVDKTILEGYFTKCGDGLYGPFATPQEAFVFEPKTE